MTMDERARLAGGLLGGMIASGLVEGFGLISAYVLTFVIMIVCLILITERSLLQQAGSRRRRKKRRYADPNEDREARLARIRADKKRQAAAGQVDETRRAEIGRSQVWHLIPRWNRKSRRCRHPRMRWNRYIWHRKRMSRLRMLSVCLYLPSAPDLRLSLGWMRKSR